LLHGIIPVHEIGKVSLGKLTEIWTSYIVREGNNHRLNQQLFFRQFLKAKTTLKLLNLSDLICFD
jgi:hypothetical protein